jgi:hypothetical protein
MYFYDQFCPEKNEPGQWIIYEPASSHHSKTGSNI